jgi:hypothetical protein
MAAATKSLDTDFLSLRTVFEKNLQNQNISSTKVLASDGQGGTFWSPSQLLGGLPTFNAFETSVGKFTATETNRTLRLSASNGFYMRASTLYGASLLYIDVSGSTSLSSNKIKIATTGFITSSSDKETNTITFTSSKPAPALSTGDLYFQQLKIISSVQAPLDTSQFGGNSLFSGNSYDFYTTLAGVSPLALSSFTTTKQVFLSIYPYTASGFLQMSTTVGSIFISTMSTISTLFITKPDFSTGMGSISTMEFLNHSTNVSTLVELSNYSQIRYLNAVGETLARAFIVQLTDQFGILNSGLSTISTAKTTKSVMFETNASIFLNAGSNVTSTISSFTNFSNGITYNAIINSLFIFSTQLSTLSTTLGSNVTAMSNIANTANISYIVSTNSTLNQLGSIGYISSQSLVSTVKSLPYISSQAFQSTFSRIHVVYDLNSTFVNSLQSTVRGLNENVPYISTLTLQSSLISTVSGINNLIGNYTTVSNLNSTAQGIIDYGSFNGYVSSYSSFQQSIYISTPTLNVALHSTTNSVFSKTISSGSFISTFDNLGSIYLSTFQQNLLGCFKSSITNSNYSPTIFECEVFDSNFPPENGFVLENSEGPYGSYGYTWDIYFKSANLNLTSMRNLIVATSKVQIDFNVNFRFGTRGWIVDDGYGIIPFPTPDRFVPISSFLLYNGIRFSPRNGIFSEFMNAYNNSNSASSELSNFGTYAKNISFLFSGAEIITTYNNSVELNHRILFGTKALGQSGGLPASAPVYLYTSPQNNIFVSIYN